MIPPKLKKGDEVRVISPAESMAMIAHDQRNLAIRRFKEMGLTITFSQHASVENASIKQRVTDLHDAFKDPKVKAILTTIGGYNSNQLLQYIDYDLIANHPKILCGFSDITALSHAIYEKTGLVTYSGPHFSSFGMVKGIEYTSEYFQKALMTQGPLTVRPADHWSDDEWYIDQENRSFHLHDGYVVMNEGSATGTSMGGNLCTLNLLQGTDYMPSLAGAILFIEDDLLTNTPTFDRDLQSLIHQPEFSQVRGVVIGRFQKGSKVTLQDLKQIIASKQELTNLPIVAEASFGHTTPRFTFPIGGTVSLEAKVNRVTITFTSH
ncbi:LD-carboxypeptidase [Halobacillus shinanisalinarum]|uniref:LD-carboxypeptidase n=1 Tax=Halobacillus shinanisalinarum TaxID=2932258 RepID=A0ABY4GZ57_9BACI|nr:S66 peptidase family protein [Halobacillus shinanisalinarum]UOQ92687.1 LD-carboxypeptidase [Halobacillus shinanisalinarum]